MRLAVAIAALLALPAPSLAVETLTGAQIRQAFEGNTVSGRGIRGNPFSEYHDAGGQAYGNNGLVENDDGCWTVRADEICYYYGPPSARVVSCFTIELTGRLYALRSTANGKVDALAAVEPGNPRGHSDRGKPWVCDGLISQAPERGAPLSRRLAAR
ncbi:hypothetical protein DWF00_06000 [Bosea caraganae]|uniref:DUF995 domain-containing protein n=1 Tax=Bosea caraganae TaxID=2763117 RepID=A0A370L3C7_9HYPH|nr:hypothetical protein [Bosea caraganae]RDJ22916.1 hypothetical protein DWE98_17245 [Bosea caraganae]RDJ28696.1 hypothetical protein DWF00_06000 [Bosea caraganae]